MWYEQFGKNWSWARDVNGRDETETRPKR